MNYYNEIKNELINNEITKKVKDYSKNKSDLTTYYNVGKLLSDAGKQYGEGIINEYSKRLTVELGKGYKKMQTVSALLSWSHYVELVSLDNVDEINYHIMITEQQNLSVRQLREQIRNKEYERLDDKTKEKLINNTTPVVITDFIKNPIAIKNTTNKEIISEKVLQKVILEDLDNFLKELGNSFCYIANEYKIKIGDNYNYIDLLLYNYEFNCFVVVELKVTELKKEHIGGIEVYMNYIDKNLRKPTQDKTIGIIICKKNNKFIMEYCSDERIFAREYQEI